MIPVDRCCFMCPSAHLPLHSPSCCLVLKQMCLKIFSLSCHAGSVWYICTACKSIQAEHLVLKSFFFYRKKCQHGRVKQESLHLFSLKVLLFLENILKSTPCQSAFTSPSVGLVTGEWSDGPQGARALSVLWACLRGTLTRQRHQTASSG